MSALLHVGGPIVGILVAVYLLGLYLDHLERRILGRWYRQ